MTTNARPSDEKRTLRTEIIAVRARLTQEERARKSAAIAAQLERAPGIASATVVALYAPLGTEVDAMLLAQRLAARNVRVVFPRAVQGDRRLDFAACAPDQLVRGPLGAREPPAHLPAVDPAAVDVIVMPGVAFSEDGLRLGRGGGYYDCTLRAIPRAARVGACFDLQVVPSLPREPHDAALDAVVTETRLLLFARDSR